MLPLTPLRWLSVLALCAGCFDGPLHAPLDAQRPADRGMDAASETEEDSAGPDLGDEDAAALDDHPDKGLPSEVTSDAGDEATVFEERPSSESGFDTGIDTGFDTGIDTGFDTGIDTGFDTGIDTAFDLRTELGGDTTALDRLIADFPEVPADLPRDTLTDVRGPGEITPTACLNGAGSTLFQFHFDATLVAQIDVWHASCPYSLAGASNCRVDVQGTTMSVDSSILLGPTQPSVRVRFNASGLLFTRSVLYVQARSVLGTSSGLRAVSALRGAIATAVNSSAFAWYPIEWSGFLMASDPPSMTQITLLAQNARLVGLRAVELCIR